MCKSGDSERVCQNKYTILVGVFIYLVKTIKKNFVYMLILLFFMFNRRVKSHSKENKAFPIY